MTTDVALLLEEFAARFARGEDPDVGEFLARAGANREELARLLDAYLTRVPPPEPPAERVELMRAWVHGQPPLLELRKRRKLRRDAVVDGLVKLLGLGEPARAKVRRYYHELEAGTLPAAGVDRRVWDALGELFGAPVRELASWRARPVAAAPAYRAHPDAPGAMLRIESVAADADAAPAGPPEQDEVDRLFRSGG